MSWDRYSDDYLQYYKSKTHKRINMLLIILTLIIIFTAVTGIYMPRFPVFFVIMFLSYLLRNIGYYFKCKKFERILLLETAVMGLVCAISFYVSR